MNRKNCHKICTGVVVAACALSVVPAQAADSMFRVSGFGTVGATYFSRDDIDFAGGSGVPNGVGRTHRVGLAPDTRAGLQVVFTPMDALSVTAQVASKLTPRNNWKPTVEWGNIKYQINDEWALRAGRIVHPFFMRSDYLNARYIHTELRPAQEVYGQTPFSLSDVVEVLGTHFVGDGMISFQGGYGRLNSDTIPSLEHVRDHDRAKARNIAYFNLNYELDAWTARAGYTTAKLTYQPLAAVKGLFDPLSGISKLTGLSVGNDIRQRFETKNQRSTFLGLGIGYNDGAFLGSAEYVRVRVGKAYNSASAWSLMAGYRVGEFTPYVRLSEAKTQSRIMATGVAAQLTPIIGPQRAAMMQGGLQKVADATLKDQRTISAGVRWDFRKNMALKAQYDYIKPLSPSNVGFLMSPSPEYKPRDGGHAVSLAVDFIF